MKSPYTRLPGRRWLTMGLIHKLYLASDHLLAVAGSRYNESYQRFDFRDIQALVSRRTRRRLWIAFGLGIPAALILLGGASQGWVGIGAGLPFTVPLLLAFVVNALRGPTCVSHLRTAVSVVELPSLARVRTFERAVRVLRPRIEAAQGSLPREALEAELARMPLGEPFQPAVTVARPAPDLLPYRSAAHGVLFGLLILLGLVGLLRSAVSTTAVSAAVGAAIVAVVIAMVVSLVRQQETDLAPGVKRVVWAAIAYLVASFTLLYSIIMVEMALNAPANQHPDAVFRYIAGGAETPAGLLCIALSLVAIGIGIAGWVRLSAFRAARPLHP